MRAPPIVVAAYAVAAAVMTVACMGDDPDLTPFPSRDASGDATVGGGDDAAGSDGQMVDATASDDGALDAADAQLPRCTHDDPFEVTEALVELNTPANEESARLSPDELSIYFASTGIVASAICSSRLAATSRSRSHLPNRLARASTAAFTRFTRVSRATVSRSSSSAKAMSTSRRVGAFS